MSTQDPWMDPAWQAYAMHARTKTVGMINDSVATISLVDPRSATEPDIQFATELGLSIMLDKPIVVVVAEGDYLPPQLEKIAHAVVRGDMNDPDLQKRLAAVIKDLPAEEA